MQQLNYTKPILTCGLFTFDWNMIYTVIIVSAQSVHCIESFIMCGIWFIIFFYSWSGRYGRNLLPIDIDPVRSVIRINYDK